MTNNTRVLFKSIKINDTFHTGISMDGGVYNESARYEVFRKITLSTAICTEQHGYLNTRAVGGLSTFSCNRSVFLT